MSPQALIDGPGLTCRYMRVANADVVWLRCVLEGYEGLAALYGDGSGVVTLVTPCGRSAELDDLLEALSREIAITQLPDPSAAPRGEARAHNAGNRLPPRSPSTR